MDTIQPFLVKSCSLLVQSKGEKAYSLAELCGKLTAAPLASIYSHFWERRLKNPFILSDYHNDFAIWAKESLNDIYLAERLSVIDPTQFSSLREVKEQILEILERRIAETDSASWLKSSQPFHFINSLILVTSTPYKLAHPRELRTIFSLMTPASFFFHFIDAKIRTQNSNDDFSQWLMQFGEDYLSLVKKLEAINPYFISLKALKEATISILNNER